MRSWMLAAFLFTSGACAQSAVPADFCARASALVAASSAHWGVSVASLDGTTLCAINANQLFRPASNAKLFTIAAALDLLGPDKTFETRVAGKFDPATGDVTGDLTLIGGGDANLDSGDLPYVPASQRTPSPPAFGFHDLEDLADQLAARGVKRITGDVVGDDTLFPHEPYAAAWELDDLVWGYGAPVSALDLVDNQMKLTVAPGLVASPQSGDATVTLDQHDVPYYTVVSDVRTVPGTGPTHLAVERLPGSRTLRVYGEISEKAVPDEEEIAIDDPAEYAAMAFRQVLQAHGIRVAGTTRARHNTAPGDPEGFLAQLHDLTAPEYTFYAPPEATPGTMRSCGGYAYPPTLAVHTSSPLGQDVVFTAKVSQNLHAELLLHALGRRVGCQVGSTAAGARMVRTFALHAGVADGDFLFYDGSGLSSHDLVAPRALTQLLVFAAKQTWFPGFKAALPVGGIDGSLNGRFKGASKGKVFAKTGTLGESRALSGYVVGASGKTVVFSILDDNHLPGTSADRVLMDQLVETIAAAN